MTTAAVDSISPDVYAEHERLLWGLCYRMTGSTADADDLVQDTFLRALERPPARTDEPWRPWLVRVAVNLARDAYRRRRRRSYPGPWLPAPIETGGEEVPAFEPEIGAGRTTEGHYELLESVSIAFLLALEALTPLQRAVLLLRDVFDYDVRDTAAALDVSEGNVKTTHHRARRAMADYERERRGPTREVAEQTQRTLERFLTSLALQDVAAIEAMLADDVRAISDSGGEYSAAHKVVVGRRRVSRLSLGLAAKFAGSLAPRLGTANGLPAVLMEVRGAAGRIAPRYVFQIEIDAAGRIRRLHSIMASGKLRAIRF